MPPTHQNRVCAENPHSVSILSGSAPAPKPAPLAKVQGYPARPRGSQKHFKMGACLRKPPSAPVVIEPEDAPATALAADDLTKPPNALHVRIIRCRDLPAVDTNLLSKNSSDPYVLLECCGERARTTTNILLWYERRA